MDRSGSSANASLFSSHGELLNRVGGVSAIIFDGTGEARLVRPREEGGGHGRDHGHERWGGGAGRKVGATPPHALCALLVRSRSSFYGNATVMQNHHTAMIVYFPTGTSYYLRREESGSVLSGRLKGR